MNWFRPCPRHKRMKKIGDYKLFCVRQKDVNQADEPIIYQYDELPAAFREQVIHIETCFRKICRTHRQIDNEQPKTTRHDRQEY
jgi:hypothetical protein